MRGGARPGSGRKRALYDEKRVISLRSQGFTYQEIANRFYVTVDAIKYFFRKRKNEA
jgi:orotate phosphoribosyltransferase-like protein